jgi:hypothetical protein
VIDYAHAYPTTRDNYGPCVLVDLMATTGNDVHSFRSKMTLAAAKKLRDDLLTALAIIDEQRAEQEDREP